MHNTENLISNSSNNFETQSVPNRLEEMLDFSSLQEFERLNNLACSHYEVKASSITLLLNNSPETLSNSGSEAFLNQVDPSIFRNAINNESNPTVIQDCSKIIQTAESKNSVSEPGNKIEFLAAASIDFPYANVEGLFCIYDDRSRESARMKLNNLKQYADQAYDLFKLKGLAKPDDLPDPIFRKLFETSNDAILIINSNTGNILEANTEVSELTGYNYEEIINLSVKDLPPEERKCFDEFIQKLDEEGESLTRQISCSTKSGNNVPVEISASYLTFNNQPAILATARDISKQQPALEESKGKERREEQFRKAAENLGCIFFRTSLDPLEITYVSSSYEKVWGQPIDKVLNDPKAWIEKIHPEDQPRVKESFERMLETGGFQEEVRVNHDSATTKWMKIKAIPEANDQEGFNTVVGIAFDITMQKKIEKKLAKREKEYRKLFESAHDAITLWKNGKIFKVNEQAEQLFGYSRKELSGMSPAQLSPDRQPSGKPSEKLARQKLNKTLAGDPQQFEWTHIRKNGKKIRCHVSLNQIDIEGDTYVQGLIRDVTERWETRKELKRLQKLIDNTQDMIFIMESDRGNFEYVNEKATQKLGYSEKELLDMCVYDIEKKIQDKDDYEQFKHRAKKRDSFVDQGEHVKKDGSTFPVETSIMRYEFRQEEYMLAIARDISSQRERERELRLFRKLLHESPDALYILNPDTAQILEVNETSSEQLGYSSGDLKNMTLHDIDQSLNDTSSWKEHVKNVKKAGPVTLVSNHEKKNSSTFPVEVRVDYVALENGEDRMVALARDISDIRELERKLNRRNRKLKQRNRKLEEFTYAASHDLRTPLRSVKSYLQLIEKNEDEQLDDDTKEYLQFAKSGADRLEKVIDGLRSMVAIDEETSSESLNLNSILNEVKEILSDKINTTNATITVQDLPEITGRRSQILTLFQNLVENAIKFNRDSTPTVTIDYREKDDCHVITIEDNGIGMKQEHVDTIFNTFSQLDPDKDGTGLGLSLCQNIVQNHGGNLDVESELGKGSIFYVELPKKEPIT